MLAAIVKQSNARARCCAIVKVLRLDKYGGLVSVPVVPTQGTALDLAPAIAIFLRAHPHVHLCDVNDDISDIGFKVDMQTLQKPPSRSSQ